MLTIIGYSINDTIVIFDRVRENRGLMRDADLAAILNTSITQTLGRTILTGTTVFLSIVALLVVGRGDIKNFALLHDGGHFRRHLLHDLRRLAHRLHVDPGNGKRRKASDLSKYGQGMAPVRRAAAPAESETPAEPKALEPGEAAEEAVETAVQAAAGGVEPAEQARPSGVLPEPKAAVQAPQAAGSPAAPQNVPSPTAAGGYVRLQQRHKKRKR